MDFLLELLLWVFAEVIVGGTGHILVYIFTLGRHKTDDTTALAVGLAFWLLVVAVTVLIVLRR